MKRHQSHQSGDSHWSDLSAALHQCGIQMYIPVSGGHSPSVMCTVRHTARRQTRPSSSFPLSHSNRKNGLSSFLFHYECNFSFLFLSRTDPQWSHDFCSNTHSKCAFCQSQPAHDSREKPKHSTPHLLLKWSGNLHSFVFFITGGVFWLFCFVCLFHSVTKFGVGS